MKKLITIILILALAVPAVASAKDPASICGKWSFYWDTRPMNDEYNNGKPMMSFLVQSMDMYVYDNYTAFLTMASMDKSGKFTQQYPAMDGVWLFLGGKYKFVFNGNHYQAEFDTQGRLLFYMVEDVPYPMYKTPGYDFMAENP